MENEEVKVTETPKVEEKPVAKPDEKKSAATKTAPKKRASKAKKETVKKAESTATVEKKETTVKKAPAKRTYKKSAKTKEAKAVETSKTVETKNTPAKNSRASKFKFTKTQFEFGGKKYTEETINNLVLDYLDKHPYISATAVEIFVNVDERKLYFTLDGYGNVDFEIDL